MIIDPASHIGKIRLRIGDWSDLPILPDNVIDATYEDCQENIPRAAALCAQYILGTLTSKTHRKLAQIETWSGEHFNNYVQFLKTTVLNPHLMAIAPVPYSGTMDEDHPILKFQEEWNTEYSLNRD